MSFTQDLKAGQEAEYEFVELLISLGIKAGRNTAQNQREMALYDVWDEFYKTYEVKRDKKAKETGNVFLEHDSLSHSNAHFVVYKLDGDKNFYILDLPSVKNCIDNPAYVVKKGGTPAYPGTLMPLEDFKKIFHVVDETLIPKETPKAVSKKSSKKA